MKELISGTHEIQMQREDKMFDDGRQRYLSRLEGNSKLSTQNNPHKLITQALPKVSEAIQEYLTSQENKGDGRKHCGYKDLKSIDTDVAAYIGLAVCYEAVGTNGCRTNILNMIGKKVELQQWADGLTEFDSKLAKSIETRVTKDESVDFFKVKAAKAIASKKNYSQQDWGPKDIKLKVNGQDKDLCERHIKVGTLILSAVLKASGVFEGWDKREGPKYSDFRKMIGLTIEARDQIADMDYLASWQEPMFRPLVVPPQPWSKFDTGCYFTERACKQVPLVRKSSYVQRKAVDYQLKDGKSLPGYVEALNALQETPLEINQYTLEAIKWAWDNDVSISKFPSKTKVDKPKKPDDFSSMSVDDKKVFTAIDKEIDTKNREIDGAVSLMTQDLADADEMSMYTKFYLGWNLDFRGRVYPVSNFSYHRDDHIKSLFLLHDKTIVTNDDSLYWLAMHVANVWDINKLSKKSLDTRVSFVQRRERLVYAIGRDFVGTFKIWSKADKPFQFLAACHEYANYMDCRVAGEEYMCGLPCSLDGTNSGVQHYAAASLNEDDGALVNLLPSDTPQDVYAAVAAVTNARLKEIADPTTEEPNLREIKDKKTGNLLRTVAQVRASRITLAKLWLDYGVDRSTVKRNTMTYGYSSDAWGFGDQLIDDIMKKLSDKVIKKELDASTGKPFVHPFGDDLWLQTQAARFLATINYASVKQVIRSAADGMSFFQKISGALAHEGKHLRFDTPIGFPMCQRYTHWDVKKIKIFLFDREAGINKRTQATYRTKSAKSKVDKKKSKSSVAPNVIHSMDSSHLLKTVLDAKRQGVTNFFLIHDAFGTTPAESEVMYESVRHTFADMYSDYCLYSEFWKQAKRQLSHEGIEKLDIEVPPKGNLDLNKVIESEYCFS
jgi:DNA-directed RNA polymerase